MSQRVTFQTTDGVTIVGDWIAGDASKPVALMLHMMPADRTSWRGLSQKLSAVGISSLAIDLRGHGESTCHISPDQDKLFPERSRGGTLNYKTFTDADHQASRLDVDAALAWLEVKGYDAIRVVMIGASIGANLAIDAAARYPEIKKVVMLSGGLNYRGVQTDVAANQLRADQRVLLAASSDDEHGSFESHRALTKILGNRATVYEFESAGHGTTMFSREPKLLDDIVAWLQ